MKQLPLTLLAELAAGELVLPAGGRPDAPAGPDVVLDSRLATPGSVFVADAAALRVVGQGGQA